MQKELKIFDTARPELKQVAAQRWGTIEQRFWRKVDKNGPVIRKELGPCWQWIGSRSGGRYGCFWFEERLQPAHRVSWKLHNGSIPENVEVLHKCDFEPCVNPAHLFLGTHQENMIDASQKGRFTNRKGEMNPRCRLTAQQVVEIRTGYVQQRITHAELAARYGVSQSNIQDILYRRSWKHI